MRGFAQVALLLQHRRDRRVGACHLDHAAHLEHRIDVGLFDKALAHLRGDVGLCRGVAGRIKVGAFLHQLLRVGEPDQPQLAAHRVDPVGAFEHGDVAVGGDGDFLVGRLEHDRAGAAEHRKAGGVDELALVVDLQSAVAGVALAGRGLHHEEAGAVDRDVERVLGRLGRALREILEGAAVLHEADAAVAAGEIVFMRAAR